MSHPHRIRVSIVVLGDIGRSPRMQYHALALAAELAEVDLIGYAGNAAHRSVRDQAHIRCHLLRPLTWHIQAHAPRLIFVGYGLLKILRECLHLLWLLLFVVRKPHIILVQNPPAIPTLLIATIAARLRAAKLVIDWHNFAYTVLALALGAQHPVVRLAYWYERLVSRHADAHLCVSRAMQRELQERWDVSEATVLYDQPAEMFVPTPPAVRYDLLQRLHEVLEVPLQPQRPAIIVSPTSWTADEDMALLLEAAARCDALIHARCRHDVFPPLLLLITGKGPLRAHYERQMQHMKLQKVLLRTLWLTVEDYPLLLGAADLGVCLHRSSSGVDLPMKLADMCGAGLPVCALDYGPCLAERVRHGENGLLFTSSEQLAEQLYRLFEGFPHATPELEALRHHVRTLRTERWTDGWTKHVRPLFMNL